MKKQKTIKTIRIYEKLLDEGKITPDGAAYQRMQQLKLRRILGKRKQNA